MFVYTIGDIIGIAFLVIFLSASMIVAISRYIKQSFCKHEKFYETMACDAICSNCGKNLGFIGKIQEERKEWK